MKKILAIALILVMLLTVVGCGNGDNNKSKVEKVVASVLKEVNGRQVLYHNGSPYLFNAAHFRYDYLVNYLGISIADKALADGMRLIKQNGYNTVIIYVMWDEIYDAETKEYDLTWFTKQFKEAEKNDLKVLINWFGSNVCGFGGFRSWQTDREKYPALLDPAGKPVLNESSGKEIPDYSAEIFAQEEGEAVSKICEWLAENDKDHRTVAFQITDEPNNTEGGNGQYMSQFTNYANFMDKLGKVVKDSNYSMVTYTVLMGAGYNDTIDGMTFDQRIKYMIDLPNLDFVGYSIYNTTSTPKFKSIEQKGNLPVFIGLNPSSYCTAAQALYTLANGYGGYCHYQFICHNGYDGGYYSVVPEFETDTIFGIRDGTQILVGSEFDGELEVDHKEIVAMNNSISKMDELIATNKEKFMAVFNNKSKNDFDGKKTIDNEKIYMIYKNLDKQYGPAGFMLKADDDNFYGFATLDATFKFTSDITVTEGYHDGEKWIAEAEVEVKDNSFTAESGKVYQIITK